MWCGRWPWGWPVRAWAQGAPVEGRDYVRLDKPLPVAPGKIEVVEFFGYWCPHCNHFEPELDAWARKLNPAQVNFRRIAVAFRPNQETLQRLFFALESLGLVDTLHRRVFTAYHVGHQTLDSDDAVLAWARSNGVDGPRIVDAMKSFAVATKLRQARQLAEAYAIDGVPTLGIHGRYRTAPSIAGSGERALAAADGLIAQLRKG
jgi:thiol:disulfide interchange protein DsbA